MTTKRHVSTCALATLIALAGCTGDDEASDTTSPPGTAAATVMDDDTEPIDTVPPATTAPAPTTTTTAVAPIEMSFPDPEWEPVAIPTGPALEPTALTLLTDEPGGRAYDVSPDGTLIALASGNDTICIVAVDSGEEVACTDPEVGTATFADWSPDSSRIVFGHSSFITGTSGPLGILTTTGESDMLVETADPEEVLAPSTASFIDIDRLTYAEFSDADGLSLEVHLVSADDTTTARLGRLDAMIFFPQSILLDGDDVYLNAALPLNVIGIDDGVWRWQPAAGELGIGTIRPALDGREDHSSTIVASAGGLLLVADGIRLQSYTSNPDGGFFDLLLNDGSDWVTIDDLDDDHMIIRAMLSPDGAHVAAYEVYRGDDRDIAESPAAGRISIASAESLFAGEPDWVTIDGLGADLPSQNLDGDLTAIVWPEGSDRLYVELTDSLWAVDVVPA